MIIAYSYEWYKTYQFKHHIETNPYYALDSLSGHFHSINHERMIQWPEHSNGQFNMKTNNLGFKENEPTLLQKPANTYRIIVTGDSHTDGVVNNNESFPNRLEVALNKDSSIQTYEVLNGGTGFYSFKNYSGFVEKTKTLHPDLYIITVYTGNDFVESVFYDKDYSLSTTLRNFFYRLKKKFLTRCAFEEKLCK